MTKRAAARAEKDWRGTAERSGWRARARENESFRTARWAYAAGSVYTELLTALQRARGGTDEGEAPGREVDRANGNGEKERNNRG